MKLYFLNDALAVVHVVLASAPYSLGYMVRKEGYVTQVPCQTRLVKGTSSCEGQIAETGATSTMEFLLSTLANNTTLTSLLNRVVPVEL